MNDSDCAARRCVHYFKRGIPTFPGMVRKTERGISPPENKRTNMDRDNTLIPFPVTSLSQLHLPDKREVIGCTSVGWTEGKEKRNFHSRERADISQNPPSSAPVRPSFFPLLSYRSALNILYEWLARACLGRSSIGAGLGLLVT